MGDGFSESKNCHTGKGYWLRQNGDELGDKPEYSADMDARIGRTSLNTNVYMTESEQEPTDARRKLRGKTGLIIKEPLV